MRLSQAALTVFSTFFALGHSSELWLRWQNDFLTNTFPSSEKKVSSVASFVPAHAVANEDIVFAHTAAVPFRRTNYVGRGMADADYNRAMEYAQEGNISYYDHTPLQAGWENHLVLSPANSLAEAVNLSQARFDRFDLVHSSTAEAARAVEVVSGFSVSCSIVLPGTALGFSEYPSVVWLLNGGAFSCFCKSCNASQGRNLNPHETTAFLSANSSWVCQSDGSSWGEAAARPPMFVNCAVQGSSSVDRQKPIPFTSFAPRTFSPGLFPCITFRRASLGQATAQRRCSVVGLGSGSDSQDWLQSMTQPVMLTKQAIQRKLQMLLGVRKRILGILGNKTQKALDYALDAAEEYLGARTAASQKSGELQSDMDNPDWWRGWPTGGFPNRTFIGELKPGSAASSVGAHNTFHFMHLHGMVSASSTRLLRRGDVPGILCMPGQHGAFEAAPPFAQVYDEPLRNQARKYKRPHTALALCLYRSDPLHFKSALVLFSAQAMLSFPPGVAFTPVEACLLAIDSHSLEQLSAFALDSPEAQHIECNKISDKLEALTRMLVVAEAIVFFDERHERDASVAG